MNEKEFEFIKSLYKSDDKDLGLMAIILLSKYTKKERRQFIINAYPSIYNEWFREYICAYLEIQIEKLLNEKNIF